MALNLSINPLMFQSMKAWTPAEQRDFLFKLGTYLNQLQAVVALTQKQVNSIISPANQALGTISGTTTFNVNGAAVTSLTFSFSTAITLTLNNLPIGAIVFLSGHNTAAGARVLTITATTPDGVAYNSILVNSYNAQQNPLTGWSIAATTIVFATGVTMTGPQLNMVAQ